MKFLRLSIVSSLAFPVATLAVNVYDYIVVGSGPGGAPVAVNLAKAGASVLLLEAGDDQGATNLHVKIPTAAWASMANNDPLLRWDFFVKYHSDPAVQARYHGLTWKTTDGKYYVGTSPPANAKELGVFYPRAGTLDGCSMHNAACSALPSDSDWILIANITGGSSWSPQNMRQHFIKMENNHYTATAKDPQAHGYAGDLDICINSDEFLRNQSQAADVLRSAEKLMGQDPTKVYDLVQQDLNNDSPDRDQQTGLYGFPAHRNTMGRRSSARNFVSDVLNATNADGSKKYNFTLSLTSFATKILFNTTGKLATKPRAIGVEYLFGQSMYAADPRYNASNPGTKIQAFARNEVIISGGTFNTPQLLKLSGIGPKAELTKFNISVLVDSPGVGNQMQDNTEFGFIAQAAVNFTSLAPTCTYGAPGDPCLAAWYQGKGPYATGPLDALMFKTANAAMNERDIFFFGLPGANPFRGYYPSDTINTPYADTDSTFDWSMIKIHPTGRLGTVNLLSSDPRQVPDINFRFFEDADADKDIAAISEAVQFGRKIFDNLPSAMLPYKEIWPCNGNSTCDMKTVIKEQAWSHHATSSAQIGADNDTMAVLDSKFRVRGVNGLRVVDASAFPRTPGGFPVIPTFMLGMKASESILNSTVEAWM
ncbi:alcohol oxidase [Mollisia scopiformis]|uniref:Alcohol oxidase n=1 Tax=Mollisia scopiformis TaxID=149040 RepID=A0A194XC57_MOLSC|nr:alcohol oxidase [Mollisia scopiformis]KUJ17750.1 alcohol oxidase [Mollisia scopiformis]